jgi:fructose-bisphosphate aldolase class II
MPLATPAQYAEMLDAAKAGGFAIPAVNVTSSTTLNAAIRGFITAGSDGIVQDEIAEAVSYGVVKMNLDSDARYAHTHTVADHMFVNYADVVRADCGIGDKCPYDPRTWSRSAEQAMAARVVDACQQLGSAGRSLTGHATRPRRA